MAAPLTEQEPLSHEGFGRELVAFGQAIANEDHEAAIAARKLLVLDNKALHASLVAAQEALRQADREVDLALGYVAMWCPHGMDSSRSAEYRAADEIRHALNRARAVLAGTAPDYTGGADDREGTPSRSEHAGDARDDGVPDAEAAAGALPGDGAHVAVAARAGSVEPPAEATA